MNSELQTMPSFLIDSHAHLEMRQFKADLEQVLERAHASGIIHLVTVGSTLAESRRALKIAQKYREVSAVVGVHPHDASDVDDGVMSELSKLAARKPVVGIGETGLDFFKDHSPRPWRPGNPWSFTSGMLTRMLSVSWGKRVSGKWER